MDIKTPAFILDESQLVSNLTQLAQIREQSGCKILYAMKALPCSRVLEIAKPFVDGFAVSSLFEAQLAQEVLGGNGEIHLTTPALIAEELYELTTLCSHVNFNSLTHYEHYSPIVQTQTSMGLRVNPKLSFLKDDRFNPCRRYSKLGVDIDTLWKSNCLESEQISGLHFHTVFSATDFTPLIQTIEKLRDYFGKRLEKLHWLNFGGGYLFHSISDCQPFIDLVIQLRRELNVAIYIEIGNGVVGNAAKMVASVIDIFESDGKTVAILDTSVNHNPEVLPLQLGDKITFNNVGAYTLIKANRFNGHNFPSIYLQHDDKNLKLLKRYTYQDFQQQWQFS